MDASRSVKLAFGGCAAAVLQMHEQEQPHRMTVGFAGSGNGTVLQERPHHMFLGLAGRRNSMVLQMGESGMHVHLPTYVYAGWV